MGDIKDTNTDEPTKDEPKKDEPKKDDKGGMPKWAQNLEQKLNQLAEKIEKEPETRVQTVRVPQPPQPKPEIEPDEPTQPEDEPTHPEEKPEKKKGFLDLLNRIF